MSYLIAYIFDTGKVEYQEHVEDKQRDLPDPIEEYYFLAKISGMIGSQKYRVQNLYDPQYRVTLSSTPQKQQPLLAPSRFVVGSEEKDVTSPFVSTSSNLSESSFDDSHTSQLFDATGVGVKRVLGDIRIGRSAQNPVIISDDDDVQPTEIISTRNLLQPIKQEPVETVQSISSMPTSTTSQSSMPQPSSSWSVQGGGKKIVLPPPSGGTLVCRDPTTERVDVLTILHQLKRIGDYYKYLLTSTPDKLNLTQKMKRKQIINKLNDDRSDENYPPAKRQEIDENSKYPLTDLKLYATFPNVSDLVRGNVDMALAQITEQVMDETVRDHVTYRDMVMKSTINVQTWFAKLVSANIERAYTISGSKNYHGAFKSNRANSDIAGIVPRFINLVYDGTKLDLKKISYYPEKGVDYIAMGAKIAGVQDDIGY